MNRNLLLFFIALFVVAIFSLVRTVSAQSDLATLTLAPGGALTITCPNVLTGTPSADGKAVRLLCPQLVPTVTPTVAATPTSVPATVMPTPTTMAHDPADLHWHAPGGHGDRPPHEHGDAHPQWLVDAGIKPSYSHVGGTVNENHFYWKHTGFKGFAATMDGVQFYFVGHWDFNPGGHNSRFHSYQVWFRDGTGAISHMSGWQDFGQGDSTTGQKIISCGANSNVRPIINVNAEVDANGQPCKIFFETWYGNTGAQGSGAWSIDTGVSISPNYYALREGGNILDPSTWTARSGGVHNLNRRLELAWYEHRSDLKGDFVTDQWGRLRTGMNDPVCGTTRMIGGVSYKVACLEQYIAPTLTSITFPGNAIQRTFPGPASLPN